MFFVIKELMFEVKKNRNMSIQDSVQRIYQGGHSSNIYCNQIKKYTTLKAAERVIMRLNSIFARHIEDSFSSNTKVDKCRTMIETSRHIL